MELHMLSKFLILLFVGASVFVACSGAVPGASFQGSILQDSLRAAAHEPRTLTQDLQQALDELAALERSGAWFQGLGLTESGLRESAGDYAGALAAAYKELAWAFGVGLVQRDEIELGLLNVLEQKDEPEIITAANAILAFSRGQWETALVALESLFDEYEEPDGFGRWMILVCRLEKNPGDRRAAEAYKAIRARYTQFPEYWYRGARAFSGVIAAEYAENCINSSVQGPFAQECRKILAAFSGLRSEDGAAIKTRAEIEAIISQSLNTGNPLLLDSLLPLVGLPDNSYTTFAVGALRALSSAPRFREYFIGQAATARGRLAERLSYICRG
jgi:hypothetical protein